MAAKNTTLCHSYFLLVTLLVTYLVCQASSTPIDGGFSAKLVHRNSPNSPVSFKSRQPTPFYPKSAQSQLTAGDMGHYLMKLTIGNPPFDVYGFPDIGSDLTWTQCTPCDGCYTQIKPKFDPKMSSTYSEVPCDAQECTTNMSSMYPHTIMACSFQHTCKYSTFGSQGQLAREEITITSTSGKATSLNIVFGCGYNNSRFFSDSEMGVIGLGAGSLSLVSQLAPFVGGRKVSFCLPPMDSDPGLEGKIIFGEGSEVGVVSTPLLLPENNPLYFVTINGISVGNKFLPFDSSGKVSNGNMIMGMAPLTSLPQDFYGRLVAEVRSQIQMAPMEDDPSLCPPLMLCYQRESNLEGPNLTVHFEGGDVKLTPTQTFFQPRDGVFCFAVLNGGISGGGFYGNVAMSNFLIGYDLDKMVVHFKPTDCTKE